MARSGTLSSNCEEEILKFAKGRDGRDGRDGLTGLPGLPGKCSSTEKSGGTSFTVWGKSSCPSTAGTVTVYNGLVGKSSYEKHGGGIDYQCLSKEPQYLTTKEGIQEPRSYITGVEYEDWEGGAISKIHNYGVPCSLCYTPLRSTSVMIPGQYTCPSSWTTEYYGYLTAERFNHANPSTHACTHKDFEVLPGTNSNKKSGIMMHVEATCASHLCPPYVLGNELTCVVCSK